MREGSCSFAPPMKSCAQQSRIPVGRVDALLPLVPLPEVPDMPELELFVPAAPVPVVELPLVPAPGVPDVPGLALLVPVAPAPVIELPLVFVELPLVPLVPDTFDVVRT